MFTVRRPHSWLALDLFVAACLFPLFLCSFGASCFAQTVATANNSERQLGLELLNQRKFKEAGKIFKKAVDKNKADPEGWYYLGLALVKQDKETKNAVKAFESALKLRPDFALARARLSYALLVRNKLRDAMREAQAALTSDPKIAEAHYIIGAVRLRSGERDDALKEAEQAIRLDPQLSVGYLLKSQALVSIYGARIVARPPNTRKLSTELTPEERVERRKNRKQDLDLLTQAAESLEVSLRLNPSDPSLGIWQEQLATLKVFATYGDDKPPDSEAVFSGDDVTTKVRVLAKPEPSYTDAARDAGVVGMVVFRAVFAADGTVRHILVLKGLPNGLTEQALRAARRIKFVPAKINDRPVSMFIQLEYNFNLY